MQQKFQVRMIVIDPLFEIGDLVRVRTLPFIGIITKIENTFSFFIMYEVYWFDNQEQSRYLEQQLERA